MTGFPVSLTGSSPLVRGTVCQYLPKKPGLRFIPARAGNSQIRHGKIITRSVHPRSCGEQVTDRVRFACSVGSSPLVRGTAHEFIVFNSDGRFIPARAGNRLCGSVLTAMSTVHPRSCGEQEMDSKRVGCSDGSSPLVRGTVQLPPRIGRNSRFIPARAGNRQQSRPCIGRTSVHPRSCGEQL